MKVAVVGRSGQLAHCLVERARALDIDLVALGRPELDLVDPNRVLPVLRRLEPDIVINAAAMTAVDMAESEVTSAVAINKHGAAQVASAAASLGVPVIHISTDYVFDGAAGRPYTETDAPNPLSVYGVSKLSGEHAVEVANPRHLILRTAWVFSPHAANFVRAILAKAATTSEVEVVADQWSTPTSGLDLADAILHAAQALVGGDARYGLYHVAGTGVTNRSGQARAALDVSRRLGGPHAAVRDIKTIAAGLRAPRPRHSALSSEKFENDFGWRMPDWEDGLETVVARLVEELSAATERTG